MYCTLVPQANAMQNILAILGADHLKLNTKLPMALQNWCPSYYNSILYLIWDYLRAGCYLCDGLPIKFQIPPMEELSIALA